MRDYRKGAGDDARDGYTVYSRRSLRDAPGNARPVSEADQANALDREYGAMRPYGPRRDVEDKHVVVPRRRNTGDDY